MYKFHTSDLPLVFHGMFSSNSDVHAYLTRQRADFHIPKSKLDIRKQSVAIQGAFTWNSVPKNIREKLSLNSFKFALKMHLLG